MEAPVVEDAGFGRMRSDMDDPTFVPRHGDYFLVSPDPRESRNRRRPVAAAWGACTHPPSHWRLPSAAHP